MTLAKLAAGREGLGINFAFVDREALGTLNPRDGDCTGQLNDGMVFPRDEKKSTKIKLNLRKRHGETHLLR